MIAKVNLGKFGTKSAGKDPINRNLSSGIRSIMSRSEVLSMTNKFSFLYLTSSVCTRIPDRAIKLKTFVRLREATIFGFCDFVNRFVLGAGMKQNNNYKKSKEN